LGYGKKKNRRRPHRLFLKNICIICSPARKSPLSIFAVQITAHSHRSRCLSPRWAPEMTNGAPVLPWSVMCSCYDTYLRVYLWPPSYAAALIDHFLSSVERDFSFQRGGEGRCAEQSIWMGEGSRNDGGGTREWCAANDTGVTLLSPSAQTCANPGCNSPGYPLPRLLYASHSHPPDAHSDTSVCMYARIPYSHTRIILAQGCCKVKGRRLLAVYGSRSDFFPLAAAGVTFLCSLLICIIIPLEDSFNNPVECVAFAFESWN